MHFFLRLIGARKRNVIKGGKLWEVTRLWGMDILQVEQEPVKAKPLTKPEGGRVDAVRVHVITGENNKTNLTKNADLL